MIKSNGLYMSSVKSKKSVVFFFNHDSLFICLTAQSWPAGAGLSNMPPTLLGLAIALAWEVKLFYSPSLAFVFVKLILSHDSLLVTYPASFFSFSPVMKSSCSL